MTSYLGWSTHSMHSDLWRAGYKMLYLAESVYIPEHKGFNPASVPYSELVEMGIAREGPLHYFSLTRRGAKFVRELMPDYIKEEMAQKNTSRTCSYSDGECARRCRCTS